MSDYPISVVVPSLRGWPIMQSYLPEIARQAREIGGQVIVADGSGLPFPQEMEAPPVVWLSMPGAAPHTLRQAGYRRAQAPIVAMTEDHCLAAPDWLASMIAAHEADPEAAVIFGQVDNGSTEHLIDWAVYFVGYGPWAPPMSPVGRSTPGHANMAWKRAALDRLPATGDRVLEFRYIAALREAGERVAASDAPRVTHYQCDDVSTTALLMYNNGRAIAGLRRHHMESSDWVRALAPTLIAGYRTARTLVGVLRKPGVRGPALRSLPLIALLHQSHTIGESLGYALGPGRSFLHLH
jgi:hypothetical protein